LPFSRTVGNRARLYGINTVGLVRREFSRERINCLRHAFRILQQSKLNVTQALDRLEEESVSEDVRLLIDFIRASKRGVVVRRGRERGEPL